MNENIDIIQKLIELHQTNTPFDEYPEYLQTLTKLKQERNKSNFVRIQSSLKI